MPEKNNHSYMDCFQKDRLSVIEKNQEEIEEKVERVDLRLEKVIEAQTENTIAINKWTVTIEEKEKAEIKREEDRVEREEAKEKAMDRRLAKRMKYLGIIATLITSIVLIFIELIVRRLI